MALIAGDRYAPVDGGDGGRPSVTAVLHGRAVAPSIVICAPIDMISLEPREQWTHKPFSGDVVDDGLYGRGGFLAGLLALPAVPEAHGALARNVVFESVIEEACSGNGSLPAGPPGPHVEPPLIPDIGGDDLPVAKVGLVEFEVTVTVNPAYVALAVQSVNAVDAAMHVVQALQTRTDAFNAGPRHPVYTWVNLTSVHRAAQVLAPTVLSRSGTGRQD